MIKDDIENELLNIGFNPLHIGTTYLVEAIYIVYNTNKLIYKINLEKEVYKELSRKYNKNIKTIKSNIIKATNAVDMRKITNCKTIKYNDVKLTPELVIWMVIKRVKSKSVIKII